MIIDNDKGCRENIRAYPIKLSYKYLGLTLDTQLSLIASLDTVKNKNEAYFRRNK